MAKKLKARYHAIDVGQLGITGHYDTMVRLVRPNLANAVLNCGVWMGASSLLPSGIEIYRISPHITVALLLKLGLTFWTLQIWWPLVKASWYLCRWISLELRGLQWIRRNDHNFRVTFYRPSDGSLKYDSSTRATRLDHELSVRAYRKADLFKSGALLTFYYFGYAAMPHVYTFSFELMNSSVHDVLEHYHVLYYAQWPAFYLLLVPAFVEFSASLAEELIRLGGAHYVPGARMHDPVIPEKTLETMRAELAHGAAAFVPPQQAVFQMARS